MFLALSNGPNYTCRLIGVRKSRCDNYTAVGGRQEKRYVAYAADFSSARARPRLILKHDKIVLCHIAAVAEKLCYNDKTLGAFCDSSPKPYRRTETVPSRVGFNAEICSL
ncbi:hypothetical protein EVAR_67470_1 [Eumeta japonica]|uniref:Uncharacterized protein n=1 Tax=Eumeta variegata TaxID=151549 RepID=A0A4C1ZBG2_EUMVA|nr:hypothetical protein EVAR_67470_1 [Eumeta japonica]